MMATRWQPSIPDMERTIGNGITRILADAGYRGHNAPLSYRFKVFTSGQKRRMTPVIKREMRRRSAVEPVIGHIKNGHRWTATILPVHRATPSMPSFPPPAITSASCSTG